MEGLKVVTARKLIDVYGIDQTGKVFEMEGRRYVVGFDGYMNPVLLDLKTRKITHRVLFESKQN